MMSVYYPEIQLFRRKSSWYAYKEKQRRYPDLSNEDFLLSTVTALVNLERGPLRNPVTEDASQPWQDQEEGVLTLSEAQEKVSTCEQFLFAAQRVSGNISGVSSLVVATVFWSSLYVGGPISSVDINAHSFFACIMLVDQFIVATPRRLRDIWISMLFASIYLVFDFIWYIAAPSGDKVIYIILDWKRNLDEALLYSFGTVLVLIPIFTLVHFGIFRFREFLYGMCQKRVQNTPTVLSSALLEPEGSANRAATRANIGRSRSYVDV